MSKQLFPIMVASILLLTSLPITVSAQTQEWIYTVRPGDNPWMISQKYLKNMRYWPRLQALNGIKDSTQIPPGRRLRIPMAWLKTKFRPTVVQVLNVQGKVRVSSQDNSSPLQAGMPLKAGDAIHTDSDGNALLEFADGSRLRLQGNSHLVLKSLSVYEKSGAVSANMDLQRGRLDTQVAPRREQGMRYQIRTPSAVSAVRGTSYRLGADAEPVSRTEVLEGAVAVGNAGKTTLVPEGFGTLAKTGSKPQTPVGLLPSPEVSTLPKTVGDLTFNWPPLEGAVTYRVQVLGNVQSHYKLLIFDGGKLVHTEQTSGAEFKALLVDQLLETPNFQGPTLPNNDYVLRVRGIDAQGLEGFNGDHDFSLFVAGGAE